VIVAQLTASRFLGSVERQMLGLAHALPEHYRTVFISFSEGGRCKPFLDEARSRGFESISLCYDTPRLFSAARELRRSLEQIGAGVLCCHGYKADLLGRLAARAAGIPVVAVSHGWTGENPKVRLYERLDRFCLRRMDVLVGVSHAQVDKIRRAGVREDRSVVIHDAIRADRFEMTDPRDRELLIRHFRKPPRRLVGAAGRLSPEKGFTDLVDAAQVVIKTDPSAGFVLFGDGILRDALARQIERRGLTSRFVLPGFRADLDRFLPHFDLIALPSYTEGLPNIVLESFAAGVPVVATAVGGTPELVEDGVNGYLVPPGDAAAMARCIHGLLNSETERRLMGLQGRQRVLEEFTFETQSIRYQRLFAGLGKTALGDQSQASGERGQGLGVGCQKSSGPDHSPLTPDPRGGGAR
jgi:glycosyltransferase involved in cell wall biosynthesis